MADKSPQKAGYNQGGENARGGRSFAARFCVVPERSLRMLNERTPEQIIEAQRELDDGLLNALESMVKAARAQQLEGRAALAMEAVAW